MIDSQAQSSVICVFNSVIDFGLVNNYSAPELLSFTHAFFVASNLH